VLTALDFIEFVLKANVGAWNLVLTALDFIEFVLKANVAYSTHGNIPSR
jgi:hypothetical protein